MIPYGRQSIEAEDISAVVDVLQSDWLTQGPAVQRFEEAVAAHCGAPYAVATNSATSALHLACMALRLRAGDILWTSPNTFVASANCARYCGATVDFVDIDRDTYNLSIASLTAKLAEAERHGQLPKVVMLVHFAGLPCDLSAIGALADRYGFTVVEDASHAIGARFKDERIGECRNSAMVVFSFHPVKIVTTAEGGMVVTRDQQLARDLARLRSHGITRTPCEMEGEPEGPWYYQQIALGFNYRMTDLQAALGTSQMKRINDFISRRTALADRYDALLTGLPLRTPQRFAGYQSAWHLYVIQLELEQLRVSRREIVEALRDSGVGVNVHYIPVHTQPYYRRLGFRSGQFPESEAYYQRAISLPLYPGLTDQQHDFVIQKVTDVLTRFTA